MTNVKADGNTQEICHLEWFINSRCDHACKGCTAKTSAKDKPDIGLDACMEALESFVAFAAERESDADGYRAVLLDALNVLDAAATRHEAARTEFILANQMVARLFFELGRLEEYEQLVNRKPGETILQFMLKPDGAVHAQNHMPAMGAFPGGSFKTMHESSHPMRWFKQEASWDAYVSRKQKEFAKCRSCPVAPYCRPTLIAEQGQRLFYYPDAHCWVE